MYKYNGRCTLTARMLRLVSVTATSRWRSSTSLEDQLNHQKSLSGGDSEVQRLPEDGVRNRGGGEVILSILISFPDSRSSCCLIFPGGVHLPRGAVLSPSLLPGSLVWPLGQPAPPQQALPRAQRWDRPCLPHPRTSWGASCRGWAPSSSPQWQWLSSRTEQQIQRLQP